MENKGKRLLKYIIKNYEYHYPTFAFGAIGIYFFMSSKGNATMFWVGCGFLVFAIFKGFEAHENVVKDQMAKLKRRQKDEKNISKKG